MNWPRDLVHHLEEKAHRVSVKSVFFNVYMYDIPGLCNRVWIPCAI